MEALLLVLLLVLVLEERILGLRAERSYGTP